MISHSLKMLRRSVVFLLVSCFMLAGQVEAQVSEVPVPVLDAGKTGKPWLQRQIARPSWAQRQVAFDPSGLKGEAVVLPTSLQFGPDDRLYVAQKNGLILAYTITKNGPSDYDVTATESITVIKLNTPNHDDDGTPNSSTNTLEKTRQITGILVVGTAADPIIYATSSDPREGAGDHGGGINDSGLDTNSGVIHRLTKSGGSWTKVDLVRGLPRSEENHSLNGMQLDETTNTLYVGVGGFTNAGAPSNNFARITEYALSAAIIKVDLDAIDAMPVQGSGDTSYIYDMPTLDDPTRANVNGITDPNDPDYNGIDVNDPWGGNNGLNQSKLDPAGPVQLHATGFRNPYDLVIMKSPGYEGKMYSIDNGANVGWGGHPLGEGSYPGGSAGMCTNDYDSNEPGSTGPGPNDDKVNNLNGLHYIRELEAGKPYYAGHPTPVRGNPAGSGLYTYFDGVEAFRTSTTGPDPLPVDWPPIPVSEAYAAECDFRNSGVDDGSLVDYAPSTNGMAEYTASNFDGELEGAILSAGFGGEIFVAKLNGAGDAVTNGIEILFSNFGATPLDVVAQSDSDVFPGTVWAVTFGAQNITVFEPVETDCTGGPGTQDDDQDGYTNDDEIDNGTDECNAGSKPSDFDQDNVSDLNDADDDNDGVDDVFDAFAIDAENGLTTSLPIDYDLFNGDPGHGFFAIGFTGLMTNGSTNYLNQYDPGTIVAGGTAGLLTVPDVTAGDALGGTNTQDNAFQFGLDVDSGTIPFDITTRIKPPFAGLTPEDNQGFGFFIGNGDQDNYVKLAVVSNGSNGGLEVVNEVAGTPATELYAENQSGQQQINDDVLDVNISMDLVMRIDPAAGTVHPAYSVDGGPIVFLGDAIALSGATLSALQSSGTALAVGVISTAAGASSDFPATWDRIIAGPVLTDVSADIKIAPPEDINESTAAGGSISIKNTSESGQKITKVTFDLRTAIYPDVVFDPTGTAGDNTGKDFTISQGGANTGYDDHALSDFHNNTNSDDGYDVLTINFDDFDPDETFAFSIDVDPTSIKGVSAPGPGESGSISGIEMIGTTVTVDYDDGSSHSVELFRTSDSVSGSNNIARGGGPVKPSIDVVDLPNLVGKVADPEQTIRIEGPNNATIRLVVLESALFLPADGGYDIDAFEANTVLQIQEFEGDTGTLGLVDFEITLTDSDEAGGINYIVAVIEDDDGMTSMVSDVVILDFDPDAVATVLTRINAGGPTVTSSGITWEADKYHTGGNGFNNPGIDIDGTDDDVIYESERFDQGANGFSYQIPVPGDGNYNVTLYFAEIFFGAPGGAPGGSGKRVFSIDIEDGQAVLTDFDIYAEVGATTALIKPFENIGVSDGVLDINLTSSTREGKISAIEVSTFGVPNPIAATPNPIDFSVMGVGQSSLARSINVSNNSEASITITDVSFTGSNAADFASNFGNDMVIGAGESGSLEVMFAPTSAGAKSASAQITYTGGATPLSINLSGQGQDITEPNPVFYRVNAGGASVATLPTGWDIWAQDQATLSGNALGQAKAGAPSPYVNANATGDKTFGTLKTVSPNSSVTSIPKYAVPPEVFQTERWDPVGGENLSWSFPVSAGANVLLRLYLAEIFLTSETYATDGPRSFDISVDGTVPAELENIDIFNEVGSLVGLVKEYQLTSDGSVDIELIQKAGALSQPSVQAIELLDFSVLSDSFDASLPQRFVLHGNYPNPFNPTTAVQFDLPQPASITVTIYNVMGQKVMSLPPTLFSAGPDRQVNIDASNLASGVYLYQVQAEMGTQTQVQAGRMTLIK